MQLTADEEHNLKQNLIHNAVVRGSKITNITANYLDWYEEFKNVNLILEKEKRQKEAAKKAKAKQEEQEKLAREQAQAEIAQNQAEVTEEVAPQEDVEQPVEATTPQTEENLPVPSVLLEAEPEPVSGIENLLLPEKN
jgi:ATPase subunit of ABC transporter with duplicated ATPase domains